MFVVKNITDHEIIIDDLRLILGAKKQIDLDRLAQRYVIDASAKLKMAFHQKKLITIAKDGENLTGEQHTKVILDMEERLKAEMAKQIATIRKQHFVEKQQPAPQPVVKPQDNSEIQNTLQVILSKLNDQQKQGAVQNKAAAEESSEHDLSADIVAKIHAKAVKKTEAKITGNIEQESKKIDGADLSKNIDELEGLL